jgi:hypothetical protein
MSSMRNIALPAGRGRAERETASNWEPGPSQDGRDDDGSPIRGVAMGVVLGSVAWCGIALLLWFLL